MYARVKELYAAFARTDIYVAANTCYRPFGVFPLGRAAIGCFCLRISFLFFSVFCCASYSAFLSTEWLRVPN